MKKGLVLSQTSSSQTTSFFKFNVELVTLNNGEGHFVYINSCDNNYKALGVSLCEDRQGVNRKQVHQKLLGHILKFLTKTSATS